MTATTIDSVYDIICKYADSLHDICEVHEKRLSDRLYFFKEINNVLTRKLNTHRPYSTEVHLVDETSSEQSAKDLQLLLHILQICNQTCNQSQDKSWLNIRHGMLTASVVLAYVNFFLNEEIFYPNGKHQRTTPKQRVLKLMSINDHASSDKLCNVPAIRFGSLHEEITTNLYAKMQCHRLWAPGLLIHPNHPCWGASIDIGLLRIPHTDNSGRTVPVGDEPFDRHCIENDLCQFHTVCPDLAEIAEVKTPIRLLYRSTDVHLARIQAILKMVETPEASIDFTDRCSQLCDTVIDRLNDTYTSQIGTFTECANRTTIFMSNYVNRGINEGTNDGYETNSFLSTPTMAQCKENKAAYCTKLQGNKQLQTGNTLLWRELMYDCLNGNSTCTTEVTFFDIECVTDKAKHEPPTTNTCNNSNHLNVKPAITLSSDQFSKLKFTLNPFHPYNAQIYTQKAVYDAVRRESIKNLKICTDGVNNETTTTTFLVLATRERTQEESGLPLVIGDKTIENAEALPFFLIKVPINCSQRMWDFLFTSASYAYSTVFDCLAIHCDKYYNTDAEWDDIEEETDI